MKQYLDLLKEIVDRGVIKESARPGMPRTLELFHRTLRFDMADGFPLLTTKKMYFKGIVVELLWFLSGSTNIKYLVDNGVNIWVDDCLKYQRQINFLFKYITRDDFITMIKESTETRPSFADCGNIYGKQWRNYETFETTSDGVALYTNEIDQIKILIDNLRNNPNSRYHIVTAWNPRFLTSNRPYAALPACHVYFQCNVRNLNGINYLDLSIIQRSCDTFLGVPFNIASYALLLHILSLICGYVPGELIWTGESVHVYENHLTQIKEQLSRDPYNLPTLTFGELNELFSNIENKSILELTNNTYNPSWFRLVDYKYHPAIVAPLSVGN